MRLAAADGTLPLPREARQWLQEQGYLRAGKSDQWLAEDLNPLNENEILFLQLNNEYHGLVD